MGPTPAFHHLAEDDEDEQASGGLNKLVSRSAGCAQWTWEKVTDALGGGRERDAEEHVPGKFPPKKQRGPTMEKDSNDQEESTSIIMSSKSYPSRLLGRFVRKSTWQVADGRRPHNIETGNV